MPSEEPVSPTKPRVPTAHIVLGCVFGFLTLSFLAYMTLLAIEQRTIPEGTQYLAFATISLGVTLSFYFLGSAASAAGQLPFPGAKLQFRAVGALAMFLVVFAALFGADFAGVRVVPLEERPDSERPPPPVSPDVISQATAATSEESRTLRSAEAKYFNASRRVRVEYANVTIDENGTAELHFQAAAMVKARFPGRNGPWVNVAFLDQDGNVIGSFKQVIVASVSACGGYQNHSVRLNDIFPRSIIANAKAFTLQLPGGAAPDRC